jgi:hypothetical protein
MPQSNNNTPPEINYNSGPQIEPENDLPVFQDHCRDRDGNDSNIAPDKPDKPQVTLDLQVEQEGEQDTTPTPTDPLDSAPPQHAAPHLGTQQQTLDLPSTIAGPVRTIQYSAIHDRRTLIEQLSRTIPINPYGLPEFLYRPDLLDPTKFDHYPTALEARGLQQLLGSAILNLNYAEGYPSLPTGLPVWARLEWEEDEPYNIFNEYLEQPGVRTIYGLQGISLDQGLEWFTLNYWSWRAKAYDLYQAAHEQRMRVRRILKTEGSHYELAEKLLNQVRQRVAAFSEEELEAIDPIAAVNMMEKLVRVQRVSLGLPAAGALDESKALARTPLPIDLQMRKLTKDSIYDEQRRQDDTEIDILRDSPEALEMAQDLILKLGRSRDSKETGE